MSEPCLQSAKDLIDQVCSHRMSVREVVESHLDRISLLDESVEAWAWLDTNRALVNADRIDREIADGSFRGDLFGVPVGIKDIFNTEDMPTGMGSPIWEGFTAGNDARVVFYLRRQGGIFPGKTVTAEFAVQAPGKTRNPHNSEYSPGTSSSGSAAAVASCMVPLAIGTQTAGSICRPASYCGVYGFKPSFGLVPRTGVLKTTDTMDTVGGFARTPEDLRILFDVIRVHGANFPIGFEALSDPSRQERGDRPWRIAVDSHLNERFSLPYAYEALLLLLDEIEGHPEVELYERPLPELFNHAHEIHTTIYEKCLSYYFKKEFGDTEFISPIIHEMIDRGSCVSVEDYERALSRQIEMSRMLDEYFSDIDAILTLTTQGIAPKYSEPDLPDTCLTWTLCGAPVASIPIFRGPDSMPFGLQAVGRKYNDYLLLKFAEFASTIRPALEPIIANTTAAA